MEENIVVNVEFEGTNLGTISEVQVVPINIAWEDLELMLKVYADRESLVVSYKDEENDDVLIGSQDELKEAFKVARKCNNTLHLHVICNTMSTPSIETPPGDGLQEENLQVSVNVIEQSVSMTASVATPGQLENQSDSQKMETEENKTPDELMAEQSAITDEQKACADAIEAAPAEEPRPSPACAISEPPPIPPKKERLVAENTLSEKSTEAKPRYFFLRNKLNSLVLDINGANPNPGTAVIVWDRKPGPAGNANQQWYEDRNSGTIRSKLNDLCLDVTGTGGKMTPYQLGKMSQQWVLVEERIQHRFNPSWAVALPRILVHSGTVVMASDVATAENYKWTIDYIDQKCTNRETGEQCLPKVCRPKVKVPGRAQREHYSIIAEQIGHAVRMQVQETDGPAAEAATSPQNEEETPPPWFHMYMEKFKQEIAEDISRLVTRRTVRQVLKGLDGAVIASVHGTSGITPPSPGPSAEPQKLTACTPLAPPVPPRLGKKAVYCHEGVICDSCDRTIVGIRYKCGNCDDFDLCEECEPTDGVHDPAHIFLKIVRPILGAGRKKNGCMAALLKRTLYDPEETHVASAPKKLMTEEEKLRKREDKMRHKIAKFQEKMKKEEKLKRRLEQAKESPPKKKKVPTATLR